jgi:Fe-S-cluster-containing dehydrogenase component
LGFKNIFNEEYELYQPKETYEKCTTCIEFFQSDKISNPFISGCSNLRASAVTDHEQSKTHMKAIVALSAKNTYVFHFMLKNI